MTIERVDPLWLDDTTAAALADISNAYRRANKIPEPLVTAAALRAQAQFTSDNRPYDAMWVARDAAGVMIGHASYEVSRWDNPHLAMVFVTVHPDADLDTVGGELVSAFTARAAAEARTTLMTFVTADSPTEKLLGGAGFDFAQRVVLRRLRPQELSYIAISDRAATAADKAADYQLIPLEGPAPEDWLDGLRELVETINDAPLDEIDLEHEMFPAERIRAYDAAMVARGQRVYRLLARHLPTGTWAGHTMLCVDSLRPGVAFQEDTSVVPAHRGHSLGLLLKARMLLWMREVHPELTLIDTWNAESNHHMIAVNERLGYDVASLGSALQLHT